MRVGVGPVAGKAVLAKYRLLPIGAKWNLARLVAARTGGLMHLGRPCRKVSPWCAAIIPAFVKAALATACAKTIALLEVFHNSRGEIITLIPQKIKHPL